MANATILITGGCGFFGTWIIRRLLDDGDRPVVADLARNTARWRLLLDDREIAALPFHALAIEDTAAVAALVGSVRPRAIIHLAGLQVPSCRSDPVGGARVNVLGTLNIFEAAKALAAAGGELPRIVYASSAAVFGPDADYGEQAVGDGSVPRPTTHYGAYKLCNEHSAKAYWATDRIASVGLRPLTVYGPGRDSGMTSFPTRAMAAAVMGRPFDIPFSGATAYIHMREVADMFVSCAAREVGDGKVYTVGGDVCDTRGLIAIIDQLLPGAAGLISCSGGDLPIAANLDDAALRRDYPGLCRIPLREGVAETVAVFRRLHAEGRLTV
jgi:nucleoside-diphosphate-sugar epimerase